MTDYVRMIAIGATIGALVSAVIVAPPVIAALADEPALIVSQILGDEMVKAIDPKKFRHYDVTYDESVSREVLSTDVVTKIGFGQKQSVQIFHTTSGTYSSDALLSPHVRYPGIEAIRKPGRYDGSHFSVVTSKRGTTVWSTTTSGSFTFLTYSFKPANRT
ncbi:MAG: hypothetical protein ABIQ30_16845 [Devosia sp.]